MSERAWPLGPTLACLLLLAAGKGAAQSTADLFRITDGASATQSSFHQITVPKGGETLLAELKGAGKVTYFYITDDTVGRWDPGLVLKVYWDSAAEPSIQAPLADFFGAIGGKAVDYQSALMQINQACFMCYLPMPFSKGARFVLANDGDRDYSQKVAYGIDAEQDASFATEKSRLHCEWRRSNPVKDGLHAMLEAKGRGQYVGCFLQVTSRDLPVWFGEGDTIFHLDGKSFGHSPGSEDEFGSCWANAKWPTYSSMYSGHPLNENGVNRMYRWYVLNPARFQNSLKVEIQNQHDNGKPATTDADDYTSVVFWYQEGHHAAAPLPSFSERLRPSFSNDK